MGNRTEQEIMQNWSKREKPLVTVSCITYNQEKYIEDAIKGFLLQKTDFPFEIIIHDDASTDNTTNIVREYAKKYPRIIKIILQKENQHSQGKKVSTFIFKIAQGDYIAICEGDDYWTDPQKLQIQASKMKGHPECRISFHAVKIFIGKDELSNSDPRCKHHEEEQIFDPATTLAGGGSFMRTPSIMIHRDVVINLPDFYYAAPCGDYILQFLGSLNGGALYINRAMAVYRIKTDGSWSKSIEDVDTYIKHYAQIIDSYLTINRYFNRKYEKEIISLVTPSAIKLAKLNFKKKKFEEFKKFIKTAYTLDKQPSLELLTLYHLRHYPFLIDFLYWFKKILRK